jgi:hypothetical protein
MKAVLREFHSPDLADLEHGAPPDSANFRIVLQAMIGGDDEDEAEESFDFLVCTPLWLSKNIVAGEYIWGRHYLLVAVYDFALIQKAVQDVCDAATGPDWETVAGILARYGAWEFEDYSA